ncbi:MAG TPA: hydrolase [Anaerohalosphaeraceae bacterium]|jgi:nicotinamidase-related amidase|nr:hydrolase [Anaerohalosphaeraceae bacterium]HRT51242.1 hydrolase [Anaerohalosphaeraceae bacterium]HRT87433.1 hydrolase [Anaerohalosphaeraceae bacterium]
MLNPAKCCLVVIDVQGKLAELMDGKDALMANIEILIRMARAIDIPVLWCQQNPSRLGPTVQRLADLLQGIEPIDKMTFSCAGDQLFVQRLQATGATHLILCGIEAHICVYQTAMDLLDKGLAVHIVADAISSRTAANRQLALRRMKQACAALTCTEMVLFELLRTAEHPKFRELSRLIR